MCRAVPTKPLVPPSPIAGADFHLIGFEPAMAPSRQGGGRLQVATPRVVLLPPNKCWQPREAGAVGDPNGAGHL